MSGIIICPGCGFEPNLRVQYVGELRLAVSYPSQNEIGANGKGPGGLKYRRARMRFASLIQAVAVGFPRAVGARRLWLKRIYRPGKRDYDRGNLVGGAKPLLDVLRAQGLILDDTPALLSDYYLQKSGAADEIVIVFEDILI